MKLTIDQLTQILGIYKKPIIERIINYLNDGLEKYQINTNLRVCHFLAQVIHESGGFQYFEEIASGAAYEGRKDLGNIEKGDGEKFKGRGLIQITGRSNYSQISKDLGVDFVSNPKLLSNDQYGVLSSVWFWNSRSLNQWADKDDILTISKKINGVNKKTGLPNGFEDRKNWLKKCKKIIK